MKSLVCLSLAMISAQASASVSCEGRHPQFGAIQLTAGSLIVGQGANEGSLIDVVMAFTAVGEEGGSKARLKALGADASYASREHKDYLRFDMTKLIDAEDFSRFYPGDLCEISVMIPRDAVRRESFSAPARMDCDEAEGALVLSCRSGER